MMNRQTLVDALQGLDDAPTTDSDQSLDVRNASRAKVLMIVSIAAALMIAAFVLYPR